MDDDEEENMSLLNPVSKNPEDPGINLAEDHNKYDDQIESHEEILSMKEEPVDPDNLQAPNESIQWEGDEFKLQETQEDQQNEVVVKKPNQCKIKINKILDHMAVSLFMTVITIYTLFFDDIRIILIPKVADDYFYGITSFCMLCFIVEIVLASYSKDGYVFSFFFWLDVLSTASMIFDIGWILQNLTSAGQATSASSVAKTSRAARVTRIVRLVRLIRLVRIVKLYKQAKLAQEKQE